MQSFLYNKVIRKDVPSWAPLSPLLQPLILLFSVVPNVSGQGSNRGPIGVQTEKTQDGFPKLTTAGFFFSPLGCSRLPSATVAGAGELGARALWGYGFKVLCGYCLCLWLLAVDNWLLAMAMVIGYWLSAIDYWPLAIGYDYWLLIFTLRNVAMVMTYFGYCPLSMALLITHWPL